MKLQIVGCSHHTASIELREQLAFAPEQIPDALRQLKSDFPRTEAVLLSTCNRVELYTGATQIENIPPSSSLIGFLASFHGLDVDDIQDKVFEYERERAIQHLFTVAASLDSMVMGEAQILSQVKAAYHTATENEFAGPMMHAAFQGAIRVAKRVAKETTIHQSRVSIPSVAVADFASHIFERFDDKNVLVIGAGEMGEETLRYLIDEGARDVNVVNRNFERAKSLAATFDGKPAPWSDLNQLLVDADLVISTTGAAEPIVTLDDFKAVESARFQRTLVVLDLAVPRDFDPKIDDCIGVYLYSIDDLQKVCEKNRSRRKKEWPKAQKIVDQETVKFSAELRHRITGPTIQQLKQNTQTLKQAELSRLFNKLNSLDPEERSEIEYSFDRLINKLLHPPLESLRDEVNNEDDSHSLLDALKRLFQLGD